MIKKNYPNVMLQCVTQQTEVNYRKSHTGILTLTDEGFRFEESVRKSYPPNPKVYEGQYLSMVRRPNGKYRPLLKTVSPADTTPEQRKDMAFKVYTELLNALEIIG